MPAASRYAVLFRTHTWDDFIERQYQRLRARVGHGDIFIVANNTTGSCNGIPHDNVLNFTEDDLLGMGLARAGANNLIWFNIDYPLYYFHMLHPGYDYIVVSEFDVVLNTDMDDVVAYCGSNGIDLMGLTQDTPVDEWMWTYTCESFYDRSVIRKFLLPFGVVSGSALTHLLEQRLAQSRKLAANPSLQWPMCEAFIPTELALAGFRLAELTALGSTGLFNFRPSTYEPDLPALKHETFIHPVLDKPRYIQSVLKYSVRTESYFMPGSAIRNGLTRLPFTDYRKPLFASLASRASYLARNPTAIINRFRRGSGNVTRTRRA